jgi:mitochondrial ornithine carrier protein
MLVMPATSVETISSPVRALPGPFTIVVQQLRSSGMRGLWVGHSGTMIREIGGSAAWFSTKEFIASLLLARHPEQRELASWESAFSGACAGGAYNLALFPADTVKSTMQTEAELRPGASLGQRTFWTVAKELYRAQGIRGLYAGGGITIARSIPSSAMIFWIYDGLKSRFG